MKNQGRKQFFFGIKKKAIFAISLIFGVIFFSTYLGVNEIAKDNTTEFLTDQYSYLNDRIKREFNNVYEELDALTADFITNEYVQKTLKNRPISNDDKEMLKKTLSYYNKTFLDFYLIVDNKGNFYFTKEVDNDWEAFQKSVIFKSLGDEYSQTKLLWTRDTIFGTGEMSFFVVRYIREMNSQHEPGVLVLKLNDDVMKRVRETANNPELAYFIKDAMGNTCFESLPENEEINWTQEMDIVRKLKEDEDKISLKRGIVSEETDGKTNFTIITYAPGCVTNQIMWKIQAIMGVMFGGGFILTVLIISIFSNWLIRPIQHLSSIMREFNDSKLNEEVFLSTNTELDYIGQAYNNMLLKVKELMSDVQNKEQELKESELQTMLYQIRPHFPYNTLDTIYMLARIQKEETIMKMIQALSKLLRINLSNGKENIEVWEELEHVSSYLDIQQIRNTDLFQYKIEIEEEVKQEVIMKMILQPVVENCIKYGFRDIYSGGKIYIRAYQENDYICFSIENNGTPIEQEQMEILNNMELVSLEEVDQVIKKRKGGFGISNVVKRLRMRYNDQIRFYYIRKEDGTECMIKIKKETAV